MTDTNSTEYRKALAEAEEQCRLIHLDYRDKRLKHTDEWNPTEISLTFAIKVGGRGVDLNGDVITAGSREPSAKFHGARGLIEARVVAESLIARAEALGLHVEPKILHEARIQIVSRWHEIEEKA